MPEDKYLSASRIKTLENCSWTYWASYHLKIPQDSNSGADRGTIVHLVFEVLLAKRRDKYINKIKKSKNINSCPSIDRLVKKYIKKFNLTDEDYQMCNDMILVGLCTDFYGPRPKKSIVAIDAEMEFEIKNESPKYYIKGFIDKRIEYPKEILIQDYKSSKKKFEGDEIDSNIQGMMYSLVSKKMNSEKTPSAEFIFLRYPDDPKQKVSFTDEQLHGFELYLEYINQIVNNFSEADAKSNFAADEEMPKKGFKGPLLCGFAKKPGQLKKNGEPMWHCPYKFGFEYYEILKDDGSVSHTSKYKPKDGVNFNVKRYDGCPKHVQPAKESVFNFLDI